MGRSRLPRAARVGANRCRVPRRCAPGIVPGVGLGIRAPGLVLSAVVALAARHAQAQGAALSIRQIMGSGGESRSGCDRARELQTAFPFPHTAGHRRQGRHPSAPSRTGLPRQDGHALRCPY